MSLICQIYFGLLNAKSALVFEMPNLLWSFKCIQQKNWLPFLSEIQLKDSCRQSNCSKAVLSEFQLEDSCCQNNHWMQLSFTNLGKFRSLLMFDTWSAVFAICSSQASGISRVIAHKSYIRLFLVITFTFTFLGVLFSWNWVR